MLGERASIRPASPARPTFARDLMDAVCGFLCIAAVLAGVAVCLGGAAYAMEAAKIGDAVARASAMSLGRSVCLAGCAWTLGAVGAVVMMARRGMR